MKLAENMAAWLFEYKVRVLRNALVKKYTPYLNEVLTLWVRGTHEANLARDRVVVALITTLKRSYTRATQTPDRNWHPETTHPDDRLGVENDAMPTGIGLTEVEATARTWDTDVLRQLEFYADPRNTVCDASAQGLRNELRASLWAGLARGEFTPARGTSIIEHSKRMRETFERIQNIDVRVRSTSEAYTGGPALGYALYGVGAFFHSIEETEAVQKVRAMVNCSNSRFYFVPDAGGPLS